MTVESWRSVVGYEGYYEVSDFGRVRSIARKVVDSNGIARNYRGRELKIQLSTAGYPMVGLYREGSGKTIAIHVLVAAAFIGPRPHRYDVAHSDGNKLNPRLGNLRYATRKENCDDQIIHGTKVVGSKIGTSKLSASDILSIRDRLESGEKGVDLAREFDVSNPTISDIRHRRTWFHLQD